MVFSVFGVEAQPLAFKPYIESTVEEVILPRHEAFAKAAAGQQDLVIRLCDSPSLETLTGARAAFAKVVTTWPRFHNSPAFLSENRPPMSRYFTVPNNG